MLTFLFISFGITSIIIGVTLMFWGCVLFDKGFMETRYNLTPFYFRFSYFIGLEILGVLICYGAIRFLNISVW